jgi:nicotinamide-nucleotide amidase
VSEEAVTEMVKGALNVLKTDYAVATSGIMGPGGGTAEKPVGLVWMAVANKDRIKTLKINYPFDRDRNIQYTAATALNLLRRFIIEQESDRKTD